MALLSTQKKFMIEFYKKAAEICPVYGLKAIGAITAQAMCESNWNRSTLSKTFHNYFGMKCGSSYKGNSVNMKTQEEYTKGSMTTIKDNFRVFGSLEEGIKGYCEFITGYNRYKNLIGLEDNEKYIRTIKNDGWATSTAYVHTLLGILNNYVQPICGSTDASGYPAPKYYPAYDGFSISIVVALRAVGADFSYQNRKKIAAANDICGYKGTASQNSKLLSLLRQGKLIKV